MGTSYKLRQLSDPSVLKGISRPLLLRFLEPYRAYLAGRHFILEDSDRLNYFLLAGILMAPNETTPKSLLDALFFIDEMSAPSLFDRLHEQAAARSLAFDVDEKTTGADLAVRIWLAAPHALEQLHAEYAATKCRSFQCFQPLSWRTPQAGVRRQEPLRPVGGTPAVLAGPNERHGHKPPVTGELIWRTSTGSTQTKSNRPPPSIRSPRASTWRRSQARR